MGVRFFLLFLLRNGCEEKFLGGTAEGCVCQGVCNLVVLSNTACCFFFLVRKARTICKAMGLEDHLGLNVENNAIEIWSYQKQSPVVAKRYSFS